MTPTERSPDSRRFMNVSYKGHLRERDRNRIVYGNGPRRNIRREVGTFCGSGRYNKEDDESREAR